VIVTVTARNQNGVVVNRRGGGSLVAQLLPGFNPGVGDLGWLEGGTLYPLPGAVSWASALQKVLNTYVKIVLLSPGDSYTLEDGSSGTAGPNGAIIEVPAGVPIRTSGVLAGEVTVPPGALIGNFTANSVIYVYSRNGAALLLTPSTDRLVSV
jgi:hypothetical protein